MKHETLYDFRTTNRNSHAINSRITVLGKTLRIWLLGAQKTAEIDYLETSFQENRQPQQRFAHLEPMGSGRQNGRSFCVGSRDHKLRKDDIRDCCWCGWIGVDAFRGQFLDLKKTTVMLQMK